MIPHFEIPGKPIPLQRHRNVGKMCYDPQKKEKAFYRRQIEHLTKHLFPASHAIKLVVEYHMPIPKSYSKIRSAECLNGPHFKKPDLSNLIKFTEDALNEVVWADDALICEIEAKKFYAKEAKTIFKIINMVNTV